MEDAKKECQACSTCREQANLEGASLVPHGSFLILIGLLFSLVLMGICGRMWFVAEKAREHSFVLVMALAEVGLCCVVGNFGLDLMKRLAGPTVFAFLDIEDKGLHVHLTDPREEKVKPETVFKLPKDGLFRRPRILGTGAEHWRLTGEYGWTKIVDENGSMLTNLSAANVLALNIQLQIVGTYESVSDLWWRSRATEDHLLDFQNEAADAKDERDRLGVGIVSVLSQHADVISDSLSTDTFGWRERLGEVLNGFGQTLVNGWRQRDWQKRNERPRKPSLLN